MPSIEDPASVEAALADRERLGVRPQDEAIPSHLGAGALARTFGRWVRMRDDAGHDAAKLAIVDALDGIEEAEVERQARIQSTIAFEGGWDHWIWASSAASMAGLLGLPIRDVDEQRALVAEMHAIARALAPAARPELVARADRACLDLLGRLGAPHIRSLELPERDDELANRLALVWQSFEAGAALLGQAVVALTGNPPLRRPGTMRLWLPQLLRERGAVLSTRRFARTDDVRVGAEALARGEVALVGLRAHPFGHGPHACPGRDVALTIAATALETLLVRDVAWPAPKDFLKLPNMSIPIFQENPR